MNGEHTFCRILLAQTRARAIEIGIPRRILQRGRKGNVGISGSRKDHYVEFVEGGLQSGEVFHFRACCRYDAFARAIEKLITRKEQEIEKDNERIMTTFVCKWCEETKPLKELTTYAGKPVCLSCHADLENE